MLVALLGLSGGGVRWLAGFGGLGFHVSPGSSAFRLLALRGFCRLRALCVQAPQGKGELPGFGD